MKVVRQKGLFYLVSIFSILVLLTSCSTVKMVSDYDESIDKGAAALHKKLDTYFVSLQTISNDKKKYKNQQKFYQEAVVDLNALKVRASAIYKNELSQEQLEIIEENLAYLVLLHKGCVTSKLSDVQKNNVKQYGIDISQDCKKAHGATIDISNRGNKVLNSALVSPIQSMFNQKFGVVMALELAKKRGEDK